MMYGFAGMATLALAIVVAAVIAGYADTAFLQAGAEIALEAAERAGEASAEAPAAEGESW